MPKVNKWVGDAMESILASKMPWMRVMEIYSLNPHIKKVRFQGNLSGMNFHLGYAVAIRVSETEFRNYTVSFSDVKSGVLEIIFHMHGPAPGSLFIAQLAVGDEIRISMPRGKKQYDSQVKQQFIFGDETSLGLACAFFPLLKRNRHHFQFYFELDDANQNLPERLGLENYVVFPKGSLFKQEGLISLLPLFKTSGWQTSNFILTGNIKSIQTFRKVLKSNAVKGKIFTKGYWLEGRAGL